jgi:hypothetical protein
MPKKALPSLSLEPAVLPTKLTTQHIGRLGELLVQYRLLEHGIDSAAMTTDAGVDLVAYSAAQEKSFAIQVKTNLKPKPGGGKGSPGVDWWIGEDCPATLYALVDISTRRVWLFDKKEIVANAQQHPKGRYHLGMATKPGSLVYERHGTHRFEKFLLENRVSKLFL